MGLFDAPPTNTAQGVNDIPAPRSDATVNLPPADQHNRVIDFVREVPNARYVIGVPPPLGLVRIGYSFDSRANRDVPDAELCRTNPQGGRSCIKLAMQSKALFKSMQTLGFYCALPAEPHRTDMQCDPMPR